MRSFLPLIANVVFAAAIYFGFIVFFGKRDVGDAIVDAVIFAVVYGAVQVAVRLYKARKQ